MVFLWLSVRLLCSSDSRFCLLTILWRGGCSLMRCCPFSIFLDCSSLFVLFFRCSKIWYSRCAVSLMCSLFRCVWWLVSLIEFDVFEFYGFWFFV